MVAARFGNDISRLEKDEASLVQSWCLKFKVSFFNAFPFASIQLQEVIRREARKKGYIVVEDETGLKVSRMYMASARYRVLLDRSDRTHCPRSEAPEATKLGLQNAGCWCRWAWVYL